MNNVPSEQKAQILFVDDEQNILRAIERLFLDEPFEIFTAGSGQQGLDILKTHPDVALIVSDQRMPGMSGVDFLVQSREIAPDALRMVLTGYADITAAVDAINKGGAYRYVAKPWKDDELVQVVREAVERHRLQQENRRLAGIVEKQNEELKKWNSELEYYVQLQTVDIQKKNKALEALNERLMKNFSDTIGAFAGLLELRDKTALSHSRNVAAVVSLAARNLAVPAEEAETITMAALLHDIGKIGIPDALLVKSYEAMSPEERKEFSLHPVRGQAAIDGIEDLRPAGKIIRSHHEALDGSGFPDRLRGENIPLGSRIIAVADAFDRAFTHLQGTNAVDLAWSRIKQEEGIKFDPAVCCAAEQPIRNVYAGMLPRNNMVEAEISFPDLVEGMVLARDVRSGSGLLLLSKGTSLDAKNLQALKRYHQLDPAKGGVHVWSKR